ncbi:uncharacterized protein DSM5745_10613 [Aspergillus mulundensis]|uniref:Protein kinase domain-containing protein n=1 Tax=Aspergillus mulundensis TaxID=1810919 RepID=A0A3D8QH37_9EURO|nr:hypothetical protein DSM5745_10613 [Aspergillus mulundensis]RDW61115.1 hypothetical protein DSM5745_10613 [Aspergillus mulundensis]
MNTPISLERYPRDGPPQVCGALTVHQGEEVFTWRMGQRYFSYVRMVVEDALGAVYIGKFKHEVGLPRSLDELAGIKRIFVDDYLDLNMTRPYLMTGGLYFKAPNLFAYAENGFRKRMQRELDVCEFLRTRPHPHLAAYYGYQEDRDGIPGLCFKRYECTLLEKVNPRRLDRSSFRMSSRNLVTADMRERLAGIRSAIEHLHAHGIVHNDVNPTTIMLDENGTFVLISFGSCRNIGEPMGRPIDGMRQAYGWHESYARTAVEQHDLDAFRNLEEWLVGPRLARGNCFTQRIPRGALGAEAGCHCCGQYHAY